MHSTNYVNTLITVAPDTKAESATEPPTGKASIAELQFAMVHGHDYEFTSDDVIFTVFAERKGISAAERNAAREEFFSKGQPCMRTSPLGKTYGWGIHSDDQGRLALVPVGSPRYEDLLNDETTAKKAAMKTKR